MIFYEWKVTDKDTVKVDVLTAVDYVLKRFEKDGMDVEVLIEGDEEIRRLNNTYRGIDKTTDVLSFPNYDDVSGINSGYLGSIAISFPKAKSQAEEYGHGIRREMCFLCVHGMLHLLGYDHIEPQEEEEMKCLAEEILSRLQINRTDG